MSSDKARKIIIILLSIHLVLTAILLVDSFVNKKDNINIP